MNCKFCGNQLSQNDKFCTKCGKPLPASAQSKSVLGDKSGGKTKKAGGFLSEIAYAVREVLKNPKKLAPTFVLAGVWIVFSLLSGFGANVPFLRFLYTLTYANGGMYGGFFGTLGGIFGKAVFAGIVNSVVLSICERKNPFAGIRKSLGRTFGKAAFSGVSAIAPFLIGSGAGVILYWIFNMTASPVNCAVAVAGAAGALLALCRQRGLLFSLVFALAGRLSRGRVPSQIAVSRVIAGFSAGFALGLPLTFTRFGWLLFLAGAVLLAVGIVLTVIGKNGTKKMAATAAILLIVGTALSPIAFAAEGSGGGFPFEKYEDKKIELGFSEYPTQENSLVKSGETELMINEPIYVRAYENGEIIARQSARLTIKKISGMYEASLNDYPAFYYEVRLYDEEKKEEQLGVWNDRLERIPKNGIREEDGDITTRTMLSRGNKIVFDEYYEHFLNGVMEWKGHSYECISPVDEFPDLYLYIRCDVSDDVNPSHPEMDAAEFDRLYGLGQQLLDTDYAVKWENDLETTNDGEDAVPTDAKADELSPNGSTGDSDGSASDSDGSDGDDAEIPYVPYHGRLTYTNGDVNKYGQPFPDLMDFDGDGDIDYADRALQHVLVHNPNALDLPGSAVGIVLVSLLTALLGGAGAVIASVAGSVLGSAASAAGSVADALGNLSSPDSGGGTKEDLGPHIVRDADGDLEVTDPVTGEKRIYVAQGDGNYTNPLTGATYTEAELKESLESREENADLLRQDKAAADAAVSAQRADNAELSQFAKDTAREKAEERAKEEAEREHEAYKTKVRFKYGEYDGDDKSVKKKILTERNEEELKKAKYEERAAYADAGYKTAKTVKQAADVAADVVGTVDKTGIFKDVYSATTAAAGNAGEVMAGNMTAAEAVAKTAVEASTEIIKNRAQSTGAKFAANILGDSAQDVTSAMLEGKDLGEVTDAAIAGAGRGLVDSTVDHVISFGNEAVASSGRQHLTEAGETLASDLAKLALPEVEVPKKNEE